MSASDQAETLDNSTAANSASASTAAAGAAESSAVRENSGTSIAGSDEAVAAAKKEAADNYERYLRAVADLENFRRRTLREKDDLRQYAAGRVLEDLLPVLDNLALGLQAAKAPNADLSNLVGGISMVQEQLKSALSNHGLKEINPAGQTFDPNQHEAIASQPSPDVVEGSVAQVVRVGYSLNGRLLRPASVVVSSGPASEEKSST
jgi:molecular chaperone GrpE